MRSCCINLGKRCWRRSGDEKKWMDLEHILEIEPRELAASMEIKKRKSQIFVISLVDSLSFFVLSTVKIAF